MMQNKTIIELLQEHTYGGSKSGHTTSYGELASRIDELLEERRKVSIDQYGLIAAEGKEEEYSRLTHELDAKRAELRRLRYGTDK